MTLLGSGSDIGGSLRLPAHFCGVFALKPTDHRVSNAGHIPPLPGSVNTVRHLAVNGPIARHPADLGLWLSLVAGPDGRDGTVPPVPVAGPEVVPGALAGLRIAWTDDVGGIPVTADTRDALTRFATDLADAGCQVVRAAPPGVDIEEVWQTYGTLYGAMIFAMQPRVARPALRTVGPVMFRDPVFGPSSRAATASARQFLHALARRDTLMWAMEEFLADVDAWICPVASIPAFPHRPARQTGRPVQVDDQKVPGTVATMGHTMLASLTGHPVVCPTPDPPRRGPADRGAGRGPALAGPRPAQRREHPDDRERAMPTTARVPVTQASAPCRRWGRASAVAGRCLPVPSAHGAPGTRRSAGGSSARLPGDRHAGHGVPD